MYKWAAVCIGVGGPREETRRRHGNSKPCGMESVFFDAVLSVQGKVFPPHPKKIKETSQESHRDEGSLLMSRTPFPS